jgi:hypothetical protein
MRWLFCIGARTTSRNPKGKANRKLVMPAAKGTRPPNAGKGRKTGIPNKVTTEFRETVQRLLDDNRDNVGRWLTLVAEGDGTDSGKPDPGKALDMLAKLAEYAAPKLARTEHTGKDGGAQEHVFRWQK